MYRENSRDQEQSLVGHLTKLEPTPMFHCLQQLIVFYSKERNRSTGLPLSGRTTYITPWDCHRTSKLNFKDVPRTSEISFVRPKSIPETSKNCQKARPLLTNCMMFALPTYRKFATCVDWALRTSHFTLAGVLLTAVSSVAATFWWLRDHCVYLSRVLSWLIDVYIIKFSTATPKIFVEIIWSHYYFLIFTS